MDAINLMSTSEASSHRGIRCVHALGADMAAIASVHILISITSGGVGDTG